MSPKRYQVYSPDHLPIEPRSFTSYAAARRALNRWLLRYSLQGYYLTADHQRIPYLALPAHCRIEPEA